MENEVKQPSMALKVLKIVGNVLIYVFFAFCLFVLLVSIISKRDVDGAVEFFGYEMRIVLTGSMEKNEYTWDEVKEYEIKSIRQYSAVFIEMVPDDEAEAEEWYSELEVGDVLTFRYLMTTKQDTITHRIISKEEKPTGGWLIMLREENGAGTPDTWGEPQVIDTSEEDSPNYILGKVIGKSFLLGLFIFAMKQPIGIALIIIIPCALIIIFEIIRIVNVLNGEKRRKIEEEAKEHLSEVEKLKLRIAELEGNRTGSVASTEASTENNVQEESK